MKEGLCSAHAKPRYWRVLPAARHLRAIQQTLGTFHATFEQLELNN